MIANIELTLLKNPGAEDKDEMTKEIELLKAKREEIMKNPDVLGRHATLRLTQVSKNIDPLKQTPPPMKRNLRPKTNYDFEKLYADLDDENDFLDQVVSPKPRSPPPKEKPVPKDRVSDLFALLNESKESVNDNNPIPKDRIDSAAFSLATLSTSSPSHTSHSLNISSPTIGPTSSYQPFPSIRTPTVNTTASNPVITTAQRLFDPTATIFHHVGLGPEFHHLPEKPLFRLPCIEHPPPAFSPRSESKTVTVLPDWFLKEKERVLGRDSSDKY